MCACNICGLFLYTVVFHGYTEHCWWSCRAILRKRINKKRHHKKYETCASYSPYTFDQHSVCLHVLVPHNVHSKHQHTCKHKQNRLVLCSEGTCGVRTINLNGDNEKRASSLSHGTYWTSLRPHCLFHCAKQSMRRTLVWSNANSSARSRLLIVFSTWIQENVQICCHEWNIQRVTYWKKNAHFFNVVEQRTSRWRQQTM